MRFAVVGLYNSGSSAVGGMLHRLGADLGAPYFGKRLGDQNTVYESAELARELRRWWDEPRLVEQVPANERRAFLRDWLARQAARGEHAVGAKHPLLALSGTDVLDAWGPDTRFIWARRPLAASIAGLERRAWWPGREAAMQQRLWQAINELAASDIRLLTVEWDELQADPAATARAMADWLGLSPTAEAFSAAAAFVKRS